MMTRFSRKLTIVDGMVLVAATGIGFAFLRMLGSEGFLFRSETVMSGYRHMAQCANEVAFPFLACWTAAVLGLRLRQPRPRMRRLARQPGMAACSAAALTVFVPLLIIVANEMISSVRIIGYGATISKVLGLPDVPPPAPVYGLASGTASAYGAPSNTPVTAAAGEPPVRFPAAPVSQPWYAFIHSPHDVPHDPFPYWYISNAMHVKIIPRPYAACAVCGAWLTLFLAGSWRPERSGVDRLGRAVGVGWIVISLGYCAISFFVP